MKAWLTRLFLAMSLLAWVNAAMAQFSSNMQGVV
jgi:hypothetical protein